MNEISNRVKDEKHFAKTIMARYKMSNTKNKNFVNIVLLELQEVKHFFNLKELSYQLSLLDFYLVLLKNAKYLGVIKNNETRTIKLGKILSISEYL